MKVLIGECVNRMTRAVDQVRRNGQRIIGDGSRPSSAYRSARRGRSPAADRAAASFRGRARRVCTRGSRRLAASSTWSASRSASTPAPLPFSSRRSTGWPGGLTLGGADDPPHACRRGQLRHHRRRPGYGDQPRQPLSSSSLSAKLPSRTPFGPYHLEASGANHKVGRARADRRSDSEVARLQDRRRAGGRAPQILFLLSDAGIGRTACWPSFAAPLSERGDLPGRALLLLWRRGCSSSGFIQMFRVGSGRGRRTSFCVRSQAPRQADPAPSIGAPRRRPLPCAAARGPGWTRMTTSAWGSFAEGLAV